CAGVVPGEGDQLRDEQSVLGNSRRLLDDAAAAIAALDAAPTGEVVQAVSDLVSRDSSAQELMDLAATLETAATDLRRALRDYRERVEEDPERLEAVGERLDRIARLCRKYGDTVEDVLAYGADAEGKLAALTGAGQSLEELQQSEASLLEQLGEAATNLSRARRGAAGDLVRAIALELEELAMGGA